MASVFSKVAEQVYIEGDMIVFGYGGLYAQPKGWGLDLCYFHRRDFGWLKPRKPLMAKIREAIAEQFQTGLLGDTFVPQLFSKLRHLLTHEWHYKQAEILFDYARNQQPSLQKYADFPAFATHCLGGLKFTIPEELVMLVKAQLSRVNPANYDVILKTQQYILLSQMEERVQQELMRVLGDGQGAYVFTQLRQAAKTDPAMTNSIEEFMRALFLNQDGMKIVLRWHQHYFQQLLSDEIKIMQGLNRTNTVPFVRTAAQRQADAMMKKGLRSLPEELLTLLSAFKVPVFVATGRDLGWFNAFHEPGYLVHRNSGKMHQMIGLGLCAYRPGAKGAVFVTVGEREYPRFWHTLAEECTHFADAPIDRVQIRGVHRYSGNPLFQHAFEHDKAMHGVWQRSSVLGAKEWGHILTQKGLPVKKREILQANIEAYDAALAFEHYAPSKRMAETFAALPIVEAAVGKAVAREMLPNMFGFYDKTYLPNLKEEAAGLAHLK